MNEIKRTLKEKKFIEAYIKHEGNLTQAYLEISPSCKISSARVLGYRWLQKVNISAKELLDRLDLNDLALSQKLKEGLEAVKKMSGLDVPDHNVRVRYLDMAFKLKANYPADRSKLELTGKDGQPLGGPQIIYLIEKTYEMCPLRLRCPIEKEVREAERLRPIKNAETRGKEN